MSAPGPVLGPGPWWAYLRFDRRPDPTDRRRPIAVDYSSAAGLAYWVFLVLKDPTPLDMVPYYSILTIILPEWLIVAATALVAVCQFISAISGHILSRKLSAVAASSIYFLFANGVGVDNPHPYSSAGWWALFLGNALVVLRTL